VVIEVAFCNWHDDWQGLYIDGKRVLHGHSIYVDSLLDELEKRGVIKVVDLPTWEDDEFPWKNCADHQLWDGPPETLEAFWEGPKD
jgi:hypothetical protein